MNFFIQQEITIHTIKIEGLSNSSVLQIGSAGIIKPESNLFNTGGFRGAAPTPTTTGSPIPFIPLSAPQA